jgi:hypothetical protein
MVDDVTWQALTLVLTLCAGAWTVYAFRRRGVASGLRGAALTLLPLAALMTGTLRMFGRIGDAVLDWATRLVFSPVVWIGFTLFGVSVALFVVAGMVGRRSGDQPRAAPPSSRPDHLPPSRRGEPAVDDDLADIEAILKKRGIT